VHCGHGLNYQSTKLIKKIKQISEYNIGHFIISESIFFGLDKVIKKFIRILKQSINERGRCRALGHDN